MKSRAFPPSEYRLNIAGRAERAVAWLRALSDGYVLFDDHDVHAKLPGPVAVKAVGEGEGRVGSRRHRPADTAPPPIALAPGAGYDQKAYHIGISGEKFLPSPAPSPLPQFIPEIADGRANGSPLQKTPLHRLHLELGAKMAPFAGYDMPLWYQSVSDEHRAVRAGAGLFDVAHMGVFELRGRGAAAFLDLVTTNDVRRLTVGGSHYSYLLDVAGVPLDDLMIYRLAEDHFLAVVNASNNDKNWAWLNAVMTGEVMIEPMDPSRRIEGRDRFQLRDLRSPEHGAECRVDIALQGPRSRDYLLALGGSDGDLAAVKALKWAGVTRVNLGGFDLIVSRTGYTGERVAYELFVHPERAAELSRRLVDMGVTPCGLAARDSLRTEAGLPLYGLELAGDLNLNPAEAGFGAYVKLYKPFFIGKRAFIEREKTRKSQVSRFRLDGKGARPAHYGDPIVNARGRVVGAVTSCNIDSEGYQLGQALMERGFRKPGAKLAVFRRSWPSQADPIRRARHWWAGGCAAALDDLDALSAAQMKRGRRLAAPPLVAAQDLGDAVVMGEEHDGIARFDNYLAVGVNIGRATIFPMQQHDIDPFGLLNAIDRRAIHERTGADNEANHAVFHAGDMQVLSDLGADSRPGECGRCQI